MTERRLDAAGVAVVLWAVGGVLLLLAEALVSLTPLAIEALRFDLGPAHYAALAVWIPFMGYAEGYKGFQLKFSPRAVRRALHLGRHRQPLLVVLAPLHAMGLIHATRRRMIANWMLLLGIVALVVAVRGLPQPWRGIVDAGVVVGLSWGAASLVWLMIMALRGHEPQVDPDLPVPR